jgi:phosphoheptose isomerase
LPVGYARSFDTVAVATDTVRLAAIATDKVVNFIFSPQVD